MCIVFMTSGTLLFSQQKVSGRISNNEVNINPVLVVNVSDNKRVQTDDAGRFEIEAAENDEIRFVKEGYYRFDKKITGEDLNSPLNITLTRMEIQIPEVKITYRPTGNLAKDNQQLNESGKLKALKSDMSKYMRSPLTEPLPDKAISKTFTGHDYKVGQVDVLGVIGKAINLITSTKKPKITKANYIEYQDFMVQLKNEVNLDFLKKYGMEDEQIDAFLAYAEKTRYLSKKFRKDFNRDVLEFELKAAFAEYRKLNKLDAK